MLRFILVKLLHMQIIFLFVFKPNCRTNSWSNHCGDFAMEYVRESHQSTVFSTQINNNYQGFNDTVPKTECQ